MTGRARRTRSGCSAGRSLGPRLAAVAAVLLVLVAITSLYFTQATAEAAESRPGRSGAEETAAESALLPAPAPGGTESIELPESELPPAPAPDTGLVASPAGERLAGLASLPHESFRGRVVDPDGQPLAGAVVSFVPGHAAFHVLGRNIWWQHQLEPEELPHTTTDARGEFAIEGPHVMRCIDGVQLGDSWASEPGLVAWAAGYTARPFVCIGYRAGVCEIGDLQLEPEARVHGRVVDTQGQPLEGVVVRFVSEELNPARLPAGSVRSDDDMLEIFQRTRTTADGRFALGGLWQGEGTVLLEHDRLLDQVVSEVQTRAGQDLDLGALTMMVGGSLSGSVVDAAGQPVPGAELVLTDSLGYRPGWPEADLLLEQEAFDGPFGRRVDVDERGHFQVQGLDTDSTFALFARSPTHEPELLDELPPDGGALVLTLSPSAALTVAVVDADSGVALPEAQIVARRVVAPDDEERLIPLTVVPAPDGAPATWRVPRAGRVSTLLIVSAAGHATRTLRAPGLEPGAQREETVALQPQLALTGRIEDRRGAPIAGATVKAALVELAEQSQFTDSWPSVESDAEGRYELPGIGPGEWIVEAEAPGFVPADPVTLQVADAAPAQSFVLAKSAQVRGRAFRVDGRPAAGASVSLQSWQADERQLGEWGEQAPVDAKGAFLFDGLPAGDYRLHWAGSRIVSVAEGEVAELELREPRHPVLHATVLDHGVRSETAFVRALRWTDSLGLESQGYFGSRPEGTGYRIELPEPGTYTLAAWLHDRSAISAKTTVTVDWGDERSIEIALGTTQVSGQLTDSASGEGLRSGWVSLSDADDPQLSVGARTADDGRFVFGGLMPGTYRVTANAQEHLFRSFDPITVPADQPQLDLGALTLERSARLSVTVHSTIAGGTGVVLVYVIDEAKQDVEEMDGVRVDQQVSFSLRPGRHWVVAVPTTWNTIDAEAWRTATGMQPVELVAGEVREAVLVVQ